MIGLTGYILFFTLLVGAVLNPSLSAACLVMAIGVFSLWTVDVSR